MIVCQFNSAKDAGEPRFDPRFDCAAEAVWHLLLAQQARELTTDARESVFACEDHAMNVYYSIAMRHRAVEGACDAPTARWRLTGNCCAVPPSRGSAR